MPLPLRLASAPLLGALLLLVGCPTGGPKDTEDSTDSTDTGRYHPAGWSNPTEHGMAAKYQEDTCVACHGEDLTGGTSGQSCDTCHAEGWRTDCTFCHGGTDNPTGAPPLDIDNQATDLSFPEHTVHVTPDTHPAWGCEQCHGTPTDALSAGHLFLGDSTPGLAEVAFGGGQSADGVYLGTGSCSNLYCHGNGADGLGAPHSGEDLDCAGCHGGADEPRDLSGVHAGHLEAGATCGECHSPTAEGNTTIVGPAEHVDGGVDLGFPSGMTHDGDTCTGTCHGVEHDGAGWDSGRYHPEGWDAADLHGTAAKLQEDTCTDCHGADLSGGSSGVSCDGCHETGWRTDCVYCHGGEADTTGAPPVDIDGASTGLSFPEHTVHVQETNHAAWACTQCHLEPEDVLSTGHLFVGDSTPGAGEVAFFAGLSSAAAYDGGATCSNLYCHGDGGATLGHAQTGETTACDSCHGGAGNVRTLSTVHGTHLDEGATCEDCHAGTASGSEAIADPVPHVDGLVETEFPSGMVFDGSTCSGTCHGVLHDGSGWTDGAYHPSGWDAAEAHGLASNFQTLVCTDCHGTDLGGGSSGQGCDECHSAGWRTDCTYCHGGTDNPTGAPPQDIDDAVTGISFPEHTVHVEGDTHPDWDCAQCHSKPTDVLSSGHTLLGDSTPGVAELDFSGSLSDAGTWDGLGTCSNLYCHGNGGGSLGDATSGDAADCGSCHGSALRPGSLSDVHAEHLSEGATCGECHQDTAAGNNTISGPDQHVDGGVDVALVSGIVYTGGECTGTCHGVLHDGSTWGEGGFHADGFDAASEHGLAANLQTQTCVNCHGSDLGGGTSGQGCDDCHASDWRTDCTYCHGGTDDSTGAPPEDIDNAVTGISFAEHGEHVSETTHGAYDCSQCHDKPADALTSGHVFLGDTTAAVAELDFSSGLSSAGRYAGSGSCSNLYCHGNGDGRLGSAATGATYNCGSCHGTARSAGSLSGRHDDHLEDSGAIGCEDCHATTVSGDSTVSNPPNHVDGEADVSFSVTGMTWSGSTCTGTCHGETHSRRSW